MHKTLIKMCGITDPFTAEFCAKSGANYVGIVFEPTSPRAVSFKNAKVIVRATQDAGILPIAVFSTLDHDKLDRVTQELGIELIQYYPDLSHPQASLGRISLYDSSTQSLHNNHYLFILDSHAPGSGTRLNWNEIDIPTKPFFLAGGLNPSNVVEAITILQPYGVDVSSGIEKERGIKCPKLIQQFIENVRSTDHE